MSRNKISTITNMKLSVIVSYITIFISVIGNLVSARFILHYIGSEYYGFYTFSVSLASYISIVSTALSSSYVRFAAIEEHKESNRVRTVNTVYLKLMAILGLSLFALGLLAVGVFYFSGFTLPQYSSDSRNVIFICIVIAMLNVFLTILTTVFSLYCNYKKSFLFLRLLTLFSTVITFSSNILISLMVFVLPISFAPILLAVASLIIQLISSVLTIIYSFKNIKFRFSKTPLKNERVLVKSIIVFSSILLISAIVDSINTAADTTILGFLASGDYVTRHHYAHSFSTYLLTASSAISMTFIPKVHEMSAEGKIEELKKLFIKICRFQMIVIFFIVGGFLTVGKEFITLWLGLDYIDVFYYAVVYLLLSTVPLTINISIEIQRSLNKHRFRAWAYFAIAAINILISVIMVLILPREYSIWGCIAGTVFASIVGIWIIMNIYNKKSVGLPIGKYFYYYFMHALLTASSIGFAYIIGYFISSTVSLPTIVVFLIKGFAFVILYLTLLLFFNSSFISALLPNNFKYIHKFLSFFSSIFSRLQLLLNKTKDIFLSSLKSVEFKEGKTKAVISSLLALFLPASLAFSCFLSSQSADAKIDRFSYSLSNYIQRNNTNYEPSILKIQLQDLSRFDELEKLNNTLCSSTLFRSQLLSSEEVFSFKYLDSEFESLKMTSLSDYTSYKTSKPQYEGTYRLNNYDIFTYFAPHDYKASSYYGYVYITDYMADIIVDSNESIKSYQDIIYTPILIEYIDRDGNHISNEHLITNIINTRFSSFLSKTNILNQLIISDDLRNEKTRDDYSLSLYSYLYNNTFSISSEIKLVMQSFNLEEIDVSFFTFDYGHNIYMERDDLSNAFKALYFNHSLISVGYVLPFVFIIGVTCATLIVQKILWNTAIYFSGIISIVTIIPFGIYTLFVYVYPLWGALLVSQISLIVFLCYLLKKRSKHEKAIS